MRKFILTFCATLLAISAASAAVKPEAGKYYLIEAGRPSGHGRYLSNTEIDSRSGLFRSDDITANSIWYVATGSVSGSYTIKNYVTNGYLFEGEWSDTNVTKAETIDVYLRDNTATSAAHAYSITPVNTDNYFLNCWTGESGTTVYSDDDGSAWLFTLVDTDGQTVEDAVANSFFRVDNVTYHVTSQQNKTVEVFTGDYTGSIIIPESVSNAGNTYTVTNISDNAFRDCSNLTSLQLPATITSIDAAAFRNCTSLASITCLNPAPPTVGSDAFENTDVQVIYVPADAVATYQATESWKNFYIDDFDNKVEIVFTVDGINYRVVSLKDKTAKVVSSSNSGNIVIPETVTYKDNRYTVTEIGSDAFSWRGSEITGVELPATITTIGNYAFFACDISSVELPASVTTIGEDAFGGCLITHIELPASVTSINNWAFEWCESLTTVTSLNPTPPTLGYGVFSDCPIIGVFVPADAVATYKAADGWMDFYIADVANYDNELVTEFTVDGINYHVTSLLDNAVKVVSGDYSGEIAIPETVAYNGTNYTVTEIGSSAFENCSSLTGIKIPASVTSISDHAFKNCTSLANVELPSTLKSLGGWSFELCTSLTGIELPESITSIDNGVFYRCSALTDIKLPELITSISGSLFAYCSALTNIEIPLSVTSIGGEAFGYCTSLTSIISLNPTPPSLDENAFKGCDILAVCVPTDAVEAYQAANNWKDLPIADVATTGKNIITGFTVDGINYRVTSLQDNKVAVVAGDYSGNVVIPETVSYDDQTFTVSKIGTEAFSGCSELTDVTIPSTVTEIDNYAFRGTAITSMTIPNTVQRVGWYAFLDCSQLNSFTVADGETILTIGDSQDNDLWVGESIETLYVGRNVEFEGQYGPFDSNSNLKTVTYGAHVTKLYDWYLYNCTSLSKIISLNPVPPTIGGNNVFRNCNILAVYVPTDAVETYKTADGWKDFYIADVANKDEEIVTNFTVDDINYSVVSLKDSSVKVVSGSYSGDIVIPETVTYADVTYTVTEIGENAFADCSSLTSVEIPTSVTSLGYHAFVACSSLTTVTSLNSTPPTLGEGVFSGCDNLLGIFVPADAVEAYQAADGWKDFYIADLSTKPEELVTSFTVDNINYRLTSLRENTVKIVSGDYSGDIVIPETVSYNDTEYTVTEIGERAFNWCTSLTSVEIPATVTTIGSWAFEFCSSLAIVTSLNTVPPTTVENTFNECPIIGVFVPADAVEAYQAAEGWKDFYIADVANMVDPKFTVDGINYSLNSLQGNSVKVVSSSNTGNIAIPETVTYNDTEYTVTEIGNYAFSWSWSDVTGVELPATITTIGDNAFAGCEISSIELPASVTSIGNWAFEWCESLTTVTSLNTVPPTLGNDVFYECPIIGVFVPTDAVEIYKAAEGWKDLYIADVANKVEADFTIGDINYRLTSLQDKAVKVVSGDYSGNVVIPETVTYNDNTFTVTEIGTEAFEWCSSLTGIEIPASVTTIGDYAFRSCSSLTDVTIPASVTSIGRYSFAWCSNLVTISSLNTVPPTLGYNAFRDNNVLGVYVPADAVEAYKEADGWSDFFIADVASKPSEIVTTFTVDGINYRLTSLQESSVKVVSGSYSDNVVIPDEVTYADAKYTVTEIDSNAFSWSGITGIEIPASVTTIGNNAFYRCSSLAIVSSLNTVPPTLGENAFYNCNILGVYVPADAIEAYQEADGWSDFFIADVASKPSEVATTFTVDGINYSLTSLQDSTVKVISGVDYSGDIVIPETVTYANVTYTVTEIGEDAFYWCKSLTSVEIPSSVTTIGNYAFCDCSSLTSVEIPSSVTTIGNYAFYGISLRTVTSLNPEPPTLGNYAFDYSNLLAVFVPVDAVEAYKEADGWRDLYISDIVSQNIEFDAIADVESVKPEAGKYYLIKANRPSGHGTYLSDTELGGATSLARTDDITSNNVWYVSTGSNSDAITIQNYVTKGYLFESGGMGTTNVTSANATDIYLFENNHNYTDKNAFGLSLENDSASLNFLNAWLGSSCTTVWNDDEGSAWYFKPIAADEESLESVISNLADHYRVTSIPDRTVELVAAKTPGHSEVEVPQSVTKANIDFTVTSIGAEAYAGYDKLTNVIIPESISAIGDGAFSGCTSLATVTSLNTVPPTMGTDVFADCVIEHVLVPFEAVDAYKVADVWKDYFISGIDASSLNEVSAAGNDDAVVCYTLQGIHVKTVRTMSDLKSLTTGIYIVNGKKILVK